MDPWYSFELNDELKLITLPISLTINNATDNYWFVLDTGASNTIIDLAALDVLGVNREQAKYPVEIQTGKGIVHAKVFEVQAFDALGFTKHNFEVTAYDFLAEGIYDQISGMIGIDFLLGLIMVLDLKDFQIGFISENPLKAV